MYTLRANTSSSDWEDIRHRDDVPGAVIQVRETGQPKMLSAESAAEVLAWIERGGWDLRDAPVLLEPVST